VEDKIGALLTQDPQRLKIHTKGFCGHCLRTSVYSAAEMPDIQKQIEEIEKPGQTFKVVYTDGTVKYFNERNLNTHAEELNDTDGIN